MAYDSHVPNDFPAFSDGDVTVKLAADKLYQLHAHTLRDLSPTLREMLTPGGRCQTGVFRAQDFTNPKTGRTIKGGKTVKYRLELDTEHWCLRPQRTNDAGQTIRSETLCIINNAGEPNLIVKQWHNALAAMHLKPLNLAFSIVPLIQEMEILLKICEWMDCIPAVSKHLSEALCSRGDSVYQAIQRDPVIWSAYMERAESEPLYREAVIHLVGRWNELSPRLRQSNPTRETYDLCYRKAAEFDKVKLDLELAIADCYPDHMRKTQPDGTPIDGDPTEEVHYDRAAYANDVFGWIAVSMVQMWYAQQLARMQGRTARDGGYKLYKKLVEGDYLDRDSRREFTRTFPMKKRGETVLEAQTMMIKQRINGIVRESGVFVKKAVVSKPETPGFTCFEVDSAEMPWRVRTGQVGAGAVESQENDDEDDLEEE